MTIHRAARGAAATVVLAALGACSNAGQVGEILGSVLGGSPQAQSAQVSGTVARVDARAQQIAIQQSNGQTVALGYDNQTKVVYQNQQYAVANLERGDRVTARVQTDGNGAYYTDLVQVDESVSPTSGPVSGSTDGSESVQSLQGTVRQVDRANGWFALETGNNVTLTVSLPYGARRADVDTFQRLRSGDYVRLHGVFLNNSRVELRQFR